MFVAVSRPLTALKVSGVVSQAAFTMADALAKIPDVEIDPEGTFKYILLRVNVKDGDVNKDIVRGTKSAEYHSKWIGTEDAQSAWLLLEREKKTMLQTKKRLPSSGTSRPATVSQTPFNSYFWANCLNMPRTQFVHFDSLGC